MERKIKEQAELVGPVMGVTGEENFFFLLRGKAFLTSESYKL